MSEPIAVETLRDAITADRMRGIDWCRDQIGGRAFYVPACHHDTLLRTLDEAMVVLKDLAQSKGWLLGDTEKVSVALDNADAIISRYEEATGKGARDAAIT